MLVVVVVWIVLLHLGTATAVGVYTQSGFRPRPPWQYQDHSLHPQSRTVLSAVVPRPYAASSAANARLTARRAPRLSARVTLRA